MKSNDILSQLVDDDTDVFHKSLIDRYQHRPQSLSLMCLAEFAATYASGYKPDDSKSDALPDTEINTTSTKITLIDGFGKMSKRKQEAVNRFRKYKKKLILVSGTELNLCFTIHGIMNTLIY